MDSENNEINLIPNLDINNLDENELENFPMDITE